MPESPANPSVCAVVVTCRPDCDVLNALLMSVFPQVGGVLVVDNGSPPETLQRLRDANTDRRVEWLELGENIGVGAAHNLGIAVARRCGYSFVLLLDHDSVPAEDMVAKLLAGYGAADKTAVSNPKSRGVAGVGAKRNLGDPRHRGFPAVQPRPPGLAFENDSQRGRVAAVGPAYRDPRTGGSGSFVRFGTLWNRHIPCGPNCGDGPVSTDFLITSGTLIPLSILDVVGGMDDGLFVDYVDTEWSLRAASFGFRLYGIPDAVMRHTIGDRVRRVGPFRIHEYSPQRLYYNLRNRVLLSRKPYTASTWAVRNVLHAIRLLLVYGLLIGPRWANLRMLWRGLCDGLAGRAGRFDLAHDQTEWRATLARAVQQTATGSEPPAATDEEPGRIAA